MISKGKLEGRFIKIPKVEYNALLLTIEELKTDREIIKHQLDELRRLIFGRKSEKLKPVVPNQISLFADLTNDIESAQESNQISYNRTIKKKVKRKPVRLALPSHLPRKEEVLEPQGLTVNHKRIGEEVTEMLEMTPVKMYVRRIIRPKYIHTEKENIIIADLPSFPIPKSNAGSSVISSIMVSKFIDHLPLYRQVNIFKRNGIEISKSTIGGWFTKTSQLLKPLYDSHEQSVMTNTSYLQCDESPIKVQSNDKKGALHQGYMWVVRDPIKGLVLYRYAKGRGRSVPESLFLNFQGTLQTDGYNVYKNLKTNKKIVLLGCMAHARRYFEKAMDNDRSRAQYALGLIQKLYLIEQVIKEKELKPIAIKLYRTKYAVPILKNLKSWLKEEQIKVMPKSAIATAINYTLNIFDNLQRYTENGNYEIDNNMIENMIRPLAIGRKNYLFAGNHKAAHGYAMMYSFFATCKVLSINPARWIENVLNRIQDHNINNVHELLPQNWKS
jgi:transposase